MVGLGSFLARTMLIERLLGVGTYAIALAYFYTNIKSAKTNGAVKKYLNWYLVILVVMAFFVVPDSSADLYRWRLMSGYWKNYSLGEMFRKEILKSGTPVSYFYIYVLQKTGIKGLLPAFCALVFYSCVFYMIRHAKICFGMENRDTALVLAIVMSLGRFFEVISGVRSMVAISIAAMFIFREFVEGKSFLSSLPFYIIAGLIHNLALVVIAIRMVMFLLEKSNRLYRRLLNAVIIVVFAVLFFRYGWQYVAAALEKATKYLNNEIYSYFWEWLIAGIMYISIVVLQFRMKKVIHLYDSGLYNMYRFSCVLSLTAFCVCFRYAMFHRLVTVITLTMIPIWGIALQRGRRSYNFTIHRAWKNIALILLFLVCARGDLCGYKFFKF